VSDIYESLRPVDALFLKHSNEVKAGIRRAKYFIELQLPLDELSEEEIKLAEGTYKQMDEDYRTLLIKGVEKLKKQHPTWRHFDGDEMEEFVEKIIKIKDESVETVLSKWADFFFDTSEDKQHPDLANTITV